MKAFPRARHRPTQVLTGIAGLPYDQIWKIWLMEISRSHVSGLGKAAMPESIILIYGKISNWIAQRDRNASKPFNQVTASVHYN